MKLVDQSVKVWGECPTDIFEAKLWIERAGRTCYNSPMPETPDPDKFLDRVMSHDPPHSSMFEHSNLCIIADELLDSYDMEEFDNCRWLYEVGVKTKLSNHEFRIDPAIYGNYRAWMELTETKSIDEMLKEVKIRFPKFSVIDTNGCRQARRVTVELHTDRNILAEITRHRDDVGFSVRSQRYVDENGLMEFIKPSWYDQADFIQQETFRHSCEQAELNYRTLRKALPPQHARVALTGQVKTVIVMTAYLPEWDWIFKLRRAPGAYPQMINLMNMVYDQFVEMGYVEGN